MIETWKDIPDFIGKYQVSDAGRVRSLARRDTLGRWRKTRIMSLSPRSDGHIKIHLSGNATEVTVKTCLLVLDAFVGPRKPHECSFHKDGDRSNNRADNLSWVDSLEYHRVLGIKFPNFLGAWD